MKLRPRNIIIAAVPVIALAYLAGGAFDRGDPAAAPAPKKKLTGLAGSTGSTGSTTPDAPESIRFIFGENDPALRNALLYSYIYTIEPGQFPEAFDAIARSLGRQQSQVYEILLYQWAIKDPHAGWDFVRPLFDATAPDRWTDDWEETVLAPRDPNLLTTLPFWPTTGLLEDFANGLRKTDLAHDEKSALARAFEQRFREYFDPDYQFPNFVDPKPQDPRLGKDFHLAMKIRDAGPDELEPLIEQATTGRELASLNLGLRRLVRLDPTRAPDALELAAAYATIVPEETAAASPEDVALRASTVVARAWAEEDPRGAWEWFQENRPDALDEFAAVGMIPFLEPEHRQELLDQAMAEDDANNYRYENLIRAWAREDLTTALRSAHEFLGDEQFSFMVETMFDYEGSAEASERILTAISGIPAKLNNEDVGMIMEDLGDQDAIAAARYGVEWLLATDEIPREEILRVWRGEGTPHDGLTDDRTFGCLRCWAVIDPREMQTWIDAQADPEVREALQWLHDHPNGN